MLIKWLEILQSYFLPRDRAEIIFERWADFNFHHTFILKIGLTVVFA